MLPRTDDRESNSIYFTTDGPLPADQLRKTHSVCVIWQPIARRRHCLGKVIGQLKFSSSIPITPLPFNWEEITDFITSLHLWLPQWLFNMNERPLLRCGMLFLFLARACVQKQMSLAIKAHFLICSFSMPSFLHRHRGCEGREREHARKSALLYWTTID